MFGWLRPTVKLPVSVCDHHRPQKTWGYLHLEQSLLLSSLPHQGGADKMSHMISQLPGLFQDQVLSKWKRHFPFKCSPAQKRSLITSKWCRCHFSCRPGDFVAVAMFITILHFPTSFPLWHDAMASSLSAVDLCSASFSPWFPLLPISQIISLLGIL